MPFTLGKPNLDIFSQTLLELGREDKNLLVVTSDSRGSGRLMSFARELSNQLVEVGIAEQNLVGMSAGLASAGKNVFAVSPASFLTARALEQIKNDVCYSDNPVKLIGISAGVSYGALGSTHHSLHDIAALRAIHNLCIMAPADNFETRACIKAAARMTQPVYIRLGKRPMYNLHAPGADFVPGKAMTIREGADIAFVATGETVYHALMAAERLESLGYSSAVISMHTIKPLDIEVLRNAADSCKAMITVEEHSVHGGLGEAVAGILMQHGAQIAFRIIGIPDEYTITGSQAEILNHYGISARGLEQIALELLTDEE